MNVQFIESNGQRQYAVVPIDVYNDLLEKSELLEDMVAYEKARQDNDELIPCEVVYRLLDGENKIKVWREYRGLWPKRNWRKNPAWRKRPLPKWKAASGLAIPVPVIKVLETVHRPIFAN